MPRSFTLILVLPQNKNHTTFFRIFVTISGRWGPKSHGYLNVTTTYMKGALWVCGIDTNFVRSYKDIVHGYVTIVNIEVAIRNIKVAAHNNIASCREYIVSSPSKCACAHLVSAVAHWGRNAGNSKSSSHYHHNSYQEENQVYLVYVNCDLHV